MSKLLELQSQIAKLQQQADDIRTKEFQSTVLEIREKMTAFGITLKDLQTHKGRPKIGPKGIARSLDRRKSKLAKVPVPSKYRGPNGEVWSGRGLMPKWMTALIAAGQNKDSFLIN